ncbi:MAG: hypothetical protein OXM55_00370 [Bdellovibrionales bacterium]|nr:hypothetical protein [Bdellovibrionales bacterium]
MPYIEKIALEKARKINSTSSIYGTFAEIGAGQEVVNHFFKAGKASRTVAKSMSAYDMTFSDQIYGREGRYVSESRLFKMLDHEYRLLEKRLKKKRGNNTKFFAFADTVAVSTVGKFHTSHHHHGWMGIRFQNDYMSSYNEIILHISLLDKTRLQQYEALGVLGVNLIYSAFYGKKDHKHIIKSLFDNFEPSRVDIDVLRCSGEIFKKLDHHQLNLELIRQKSTAALLFQKSGENILPSDALYGKHVLIQYHSARGKVSDSLMKKALSYIRSTKKIKSHPISIVNIPVQYLKTKNTFYYLKKYLSPSNQNKSQYILISDFKRLYELRNFIRKATDQYIFMILNEELLMKILKSHLKSSGDILEFFSRLCGPKTVLLISNSNKLKFSPHFHHLKQYLMETKHIIYLNDT